MSLLYQIEACLRATRLPVSRFGRESVRDPRIVQDIRRGRQPGQRMEARLRAFISEKMASLAASDQPDGRQP